MIRHLGDILRVILEEAFELTQKDILEILRIGRSTYTSYRRNARPEQIHGSVELYATFRNLFGIDLYLSVMEKRIVIVDPTKLSPEEIARLKDKGADVRNIPVFDGNVVPIDREKRYPKPALLVPRKMCPEGAFGVQMPGNKVASAIDMGNFIICGEMLSVKNILPGYAYLLSLDNGAGQTLTIAKAEEKAGKISLVPPNSTSKQIAFRNDRIKGVYRVVGQYNREAGIA
jgi:hypothetical protein